MKGAIASAIVGNRLLPYVRPLFVTRLGASSNEIVQIDPEGIGNRLQGLDRAPFLAGFYF
jgi:hypothetical protein